MRGFPIAAGFIALFAWGMGGCVKHGPEQNGTSISQGDDVALFSTTCTIEPYTAYDKVLWAELFPFENGGLGVLLDGPYDPVVLEPLGLKQLQTADCRGGTAVYIPGIDCERQAVVMERFGRKQADICLEANTGKTMIEECGTGLWGPNACGRVLEKLTETCPRRTGMEKAACQRQIDEIKQAFRDSASR